MCFNEEGRGSEATEARFLPIKAKKPLHTGVRTGYNISLLYLSVYCVRVTFVVSTDCESCTRPISTNPASMEASEYGLTRRSCFVARRLEVVTVAGLLWISWSALGAAGFRFLFSFFFFERLLQV